MTDIQIPSLDGKSFGAYVARPQFSTAPCIIVIQEIFGVNVAMRQICDELTQQGYLAVCPDLFWRQKPNIQITDKTEAEWKQAFELYNGFDVDLGVTDLLATLAHVRRMPGCNGAVGTVGYCLGGKLAFLFAARADIDCAVSYYGVGLDECMKEVNDIRSATMLHIAGKDKFVPPEALEKIRHGIAKNHNISLHVYPDVDHAFARPNGQNFDAAATKLANARTAEFFEAHLKR